MKPIDILRAVAEEMSEGRLLSKGDETSWQSLFTVKIVSENEAELIELSSGKGFILVINETTHNKNLEKKK